jgi:hypothetical protein
VFLGFEVWRERIEPELLAVLCALRAAHLFLFLNHNRTLAFHAKNYKSTYSYLIKCSVATATDFNSRNPSLVDIPIHCSIPNKPLISQQKATTNTMGNVELYKRRAAHD